MPPLSSRQAAAVCGVSAVHLHRLGRAVGIEPVQVPMGRVGRRVRHLWPTRHLLALSILEPLRQIGVGLAPAIIFARGLAAQPSDEALEAVLSDRPFALIVSPSICPHTVDARAVQRAYEYRGADLRAQGRELVRVDLRSLLAKLLAQIRAVEGAADAKR